MKQLTHIFCEIDVFCKEFNQYMKCKLLPPATARRRGSINCLSESEIVTILILFQSSHWRNFKNFYVHFLCTYYRTAFPNLPSYHRIIEIMNLVVFHLILFSQTHSRKQTGIYDIDSTCLPVCHLKRSKRHKTSREIAQYARTSVG